MGVRAEQPPAVPLQAAVGPEHPPCPACTGPMFPWVAEPWEERRPVLRCERCGLAAVGDPGSRDEALSFLRRLGSSDTAQVPNRAGLAAWIGGAAWAPLQPDARYLLTSAAIEHLGDDPRAPAMRPGPDVGVMWQTLLNSFTFGRNLVLGRLGRATSAPALAGWQRGLDVVIVAATALPLLVLAALLEGGAAVAGRGGGLRQ